MAIGVDSVLRRLEGLLLPPRCVLCGRAGQRPCLDLCRDCEGDLPYMPTACLRCGQPQVATDMAGLTCPACRVDPPGFDRCYARFDYRPPVDWLVHGLKYRGELALGRVLGGLLGSALVRNGLHLDVDTIVPVSLHPRRHAERGFNQSAEVARWVGRVVGRPCSDRAVLRRRDTPAQVGLQAGHRRANLMGAFECSATLGGARIAVVDDVVTTGSTAEAMAHALRNAGAVSVDVWSVARVVPERLPRGLQAS